MANLRFPKVFVLTNVGTQLITDNTKKPHQLTSGQVGIFTVDQHEIIGNGIGDATATASVKALQIHQNIGDNRFGTVRTKTIKRGSVRAYYKQNASVAVTDVWNIGYNGTAGDLAITANQILQFNIQVFDKKLAKWYGCKPGYNKTITVETKAKTKDAIADEIVAAINNTNQPATDYKAGNELPNYVLATKLSGAGGERGVKIETLALTPEALNSADPIKYFEAQLVTINVTQVIVGFEGALETTTQTIANSQKAKPGSGFPAELAALEAESQGYDRVREVFQDPRFMKLANYVIKAADGQKYDYLFLQYDWAHNQGQKGSSQAQVVEPYEVIIAAPTGTLQPVATALNAFVDNYPAITM